MQGRETNAANALHWFHLRHLQIFIKVVYFWDF